ncbi:MAG: hypothetical protein ACM678_08785, partial [Clostridiales bacterium]
CIAPLVNSTDNFTRISARLQAMRPSLHWKNMENLIFPRKGGGIFEKLLDFTEKFYIIVELVICIAGKSLLT